MNVKCVSLISSNTSLNMLVLYFTDGFPKFVCIHIYLNTYKHGLKNIWFLNSSMHVPILSLVSHFVLFVSGHVILSADLFSVVCMSSLCYRKTMVQSAAALTPGLRRVKTASVESNSNSKADSVPSEKETKKKNNSIFCAKSVVFRVLLQDPNLLWTMYQIIKMFIVQYFYYYQL